MYVINETSGVVAMAREVLDSDEKGRKSLRVWVAANEPPRAVERWSKAHSVALPTTSVLPLASSCGVKSVVRWRRGRE